MEDPFKEALTDNRKNSHVSCDNNLLQTFDILIIKSLWLNFFNLIFFDTAAIFCKAFFKNRNIMFFWGVSCIAFSAQQHSFE